MNEKEVVGMTEEKEKSLQEVFFFLRKLTHDGFFGKVTVAFQNGKLLEVRTETTLKPHELADASG